MSTQHGNELALRQANILCVTAADRHRCDRLAQFETEDALAELIHNAYQIPTRRIRRTRCFRMDPLARQYVGQPHASGEHFRPDFALLRLGACLFLDGDNLRSAVAPDDDLRLSYMPIPLLADTEIQSVPVL